MMHNKYNKALVTILLLAISAIAQAQLKNNATLTDAFNKAFVDKDTAGLSTYCAPDFSIAGSTGKGAQTRLYQIIKQSTIKSIQLLGNKRWGNGKDFQVEVTNGTGKKEMSQLLVNQDGKLSRMTYFDGLFGMKREERSRLVAQIPFENQNGSIILKAHINEFEKPLRLLFDTGADGMAVSQQLADQIGLKVTRENRASVVGGNKAIQVSDKNKIRLDKLWMYEMGIAIFPEFNKAHADGIIGNALMRRYIVHIDYDKNLLSLYSFGQHEYQGKGQTVKVSMPSGVMLIGGELEIVKDKKYDGRFVFDTGASYNLICFRPFVRQNKLLVSGFKAEAQGSTVSMGISSPTFLGSSYQFSISPLPANTNLPVTLMGGGGANEEWNPGVDGSIGVRLLSRYNITVNLAENEIYFSPNNLCSFPQDFMLKGYLMGWDNKGQLKVLGTPGAAQSEMKLEKGQIIVDINGRRSAEFVKDPHAIAQLKALAISGESIIHVNTTNNEHIQL